MEQINERKVFKVLVMTFLQKTTTCHRVVLRVNNLVLNQYKFRVELPVHAWSFILLHLCQYSGDKLV